MNHPQRILSAIIAHSKKAAFTSKQLKDLTSIVATFVEREEPVRVVFPSFHGKVPDNRYVTSNLPDYGDYLGVKNLDLINNDVKAVYANGLRIHIVHEGHFYCDTPLVGSDDDVSEYLGSIRKIFDSRPFIRSISAAELLPNAESFDERRAILDKQYSPSIITSADLQRLDRTQFELYRAYKTMYTTLLNDGNRSRAQARKLAGKCAKTQISR
jgi:pyoverdine/dityrosine biosynthesis protein Dit1